MVIRQVNEFLATSGSETLMEWAFSSMLENFRPFSIMAFRPFVSLAKAGEAMGSMLTALSAYNLCWASSHFPSRQNATSWPAISLVFMLVGEFVF